MLGQVRLAIAALAVGLLACVTEPACGCSEPGSRVVLYGTVRSDAGEVGGGATVAITVAAPAASVQTCSFATPSLDSPAPVTADGQGRYRVEVLSLAREPSCLRIRANHVSGGAGEAVLIRTFPRPGEIDSVLVDLTLRAP